MTSLEDFPVLPPPPGQVSNFNDPESRAPAIIILCSVFLSLMWIFFLLRLYSKLWIIRAFGWEDAFAILAAVGATSYAALTIWAMRILGPHAWNVRAVDYGSRLVQLDTVMDVVYNPAIFFAKLALFLLYFRIFSSHQRTRVAIYLGVLVGSLFYTAADIVFLVLCVPRRGLNWASAQFGAQCMKSIKMNYVQGIFGVVSDLYIFILPLPILWTLQMSIRRKIGITAIFVTGLIAIIASVVGLYYRAALAQDISDSTWRQPPVLGLTVMEMTVGVICSSVPHLPPLLRRHVSTFQRISHWFHYLFSSITIQRNRPDSGRNLPLHNMNGSNSKASNPQRMQVETRVLGSIQGNGQFVKPGRFSRLWRNKSPSRSWGSAPLIDSTDATRRDFYETTNTNHTVDDSARLYDKSLIATNPENTNHPSQ